MSLVPAFEVGVWNAWIFTLAGLFFHAVPPILTAQFNTNLRKKFSEESPTNVYLNKTEKRIDTVTAVIPVLLFIYPVFIPLKLGALWFHLNPFIFSSGVIVYMITPAPGVTTPLGKLAIQGLYHC